VLTDRELAIVIWGSFLVVVLLASLPASAKMRSSVYDVIRAALSLRLVLAALGCLTWVGVITLALALSGIWTPALIKETVVFGIGTALPLVFNRQLLSGGATVASRVSAILAPATFLELLSGLYSFALSVELALLPLTAVIVLASARATKPRAREIFAVLLGILGIVYLGFSITTFLISADVTDWELLGRTIAYLVLMSAAIIPYAIAFGVWINFTDMVRWLSFKREPGMLPPWKGTVAIIRFFAGKTALLAKTPPNVIMQMARASSISDAVDRARRHWSRQEDLAYADQARNNALLEFSGIEGVDDAGQQLDRREFAATCKALMWLWACMSGQYAKQDRFRGEVLDIAGPYTRHGLDYSHGIKIVVNEDGQRWYAHRRTITGWVFAIGGNGPGNQWTYDGSEEPTMYPAERTPWIAYGETTNWEH